MQPYRKLTLRRTALNVMREAGESEPIALCNPKMPVFDRLCGWFIRVNCGELGQRYGEFATVPPEHGEHVSRTNVVRRHAQHIDIFSLLEWRRDVRS
jgi:hypothetical protein